MNSNNKPRPKTTLKPPSNNAPRPPGGGPNKLSPEAMQRLNTHIAQGPGRMHERSVFRLHEERSYIYDKMSKNAVTGAALDVKANIATNLNKRDRAALTKEAESLRPFKREFKGNNPEGARAETIAKGAKYTRLGANVANHVGTGVALVNPLAGGATKLAAKGVSIGAGVVATGAYNEASKAYAKNVNPDATGREMLGSQMAQVKSDINAQKRNHMAVMTGVGALTGAAGFGLDEIANVGDAAMEMASKTSFGTAKTMGSAGLQLGLEMKERQNKSEFVNLLQHRRAMEPKRGLQTPKPPTQRAPRPPGGKK